MSKIRYDLEIKERLDSLLLEWPDVEPGKAFGYPAYYINGKMFACVYEDGVALKIPEERANQLIGREGISEFRPMDKHRMKQWVLITRDTPEDFSADSKLLDESMKFVYLESLDKKKKK